MVCNQPRFQIQRGRRVALAYLQAKKAEQSVVYFSIIVVPAQAGQVEAALLPPGALSECSPGPGPSALLPACSLHTRDGPGPGTGEGALLPAGSLDTRYLSGISIA